MKAEPSQLPELLQRLYRAHEIHGGAISGTFRFRFDDSTLLLQHFLSSNQLPAERNEMTSRQFLLFGATACGSPIGLWTSEPGQPVVIFGSEGECAVLAATPEDFLRLLGVGYWELDAFDPWRAPETKIHEYSREPVVPAWLPAFLETEGLTAPPTAAEIHGRTFVLNQRFHSECFDTAFLHMDYGQLYLHQNPEFLAPVEITNDALARGFIQCADVIAFYVEDRDNYCCEVSVSLLTEAEFEAWRGLGDFKQPFDFEITDGLWVSGVSAEPRRFQNPNCKPGRYKMLVHSNRSLARLRPYVNFRYQVFICPMS
jgi:hypothetical protein